MIKFHCKHCNKKIGVPDKYAGKKGKCPRCKEVVIIPGIAGTEPAKTAEQIETPPKPAPPPPAEPQPQPPQPGTKEMPETIAKAREELAKAFAATAKKKAEKEQPPPPEKAIPWYIELALYPATKSGLINIAAIFAIPLLIDILRMFLGPSFTLLATIITIIVYLYMVWFFSEYIRDCAFGGTKAPDFLSTSPDISVLLSQMFNLIICLCIFWGPAALYVILARRVDYILYLLLAYGVIFFPMGFLSTCLLDSIAAFSPILLVKSISRTLSTYALHVLTFCCLGSLAALVVWLSLKSVVLTLLGHLLRAIWIYMATLAVFKLGRFHWIYLKKLNWKVQIPD